MNKRRITVWGTRFAFDVEVAWRRQFPLFDAIELRGQAHRHDGTPPSVRVSRAAGVIRWPASCYCLGVAIPVRILGCMSNHLESGLGATHTCKGGKEVRDLHLPSRSSTVYCIPRMCTIAASPLSPRNPLISSNARALIGTLRRLPPSLRDVQGHPGNTRDFTEQSILGDHTILRLTNPLPASH